jgi:adenosine deaminase
MISEPFIRALRSKSFIRALPKAELHIHIEGTLEPELMFALAARNGVALPFKSVDAVKKAYAFRNLQDFLNIYYKGAEVLRTEEDFSDLALAYFRRLSLDGGIHAEIFFDPQTHTDRGIPFSVVADGLLAGMAQAREEWGVSSRLILCFLRHLDEASAFATLKQAENYLDRIAAVGLDSSEVGNPPSKFRKVFDVARTLGLKVVAHAGEEGPPSYVWEAIELLGVDRIDHGNRALEDDRLIEKVIERQITLTMCPLSNQRLRVISDLRDHPLKRMLDLGVKVTINSDDPAYFGGYLLENYLTVARALNLSKTDLLRLATNSVTGSFMTITEKAQALAKLKTIASKTD